MRDLNNTKGFSSMPFVIRLTASSSGRETCNVSEGWRRTEMSLLTFQCCAVALCATFLVFFKDSTVQGVLQQAGGHSIDEANFVLSFGAFSFKLRP